MDIYSFENEYLSVKGDIYGHIGCIRLYLLIAEFTQHTVTDPKM